MFAVGIGRVAHALRLALARHLHQAKVRDGQHVCLGLVLAKPVAHPLEHLTPIARRLHVDEVQHDQATDVSESQLATDLLRRLKVHPQQRFVLFLFVVVLIPMAAGVDVDRDECLGFVNDDVATAWQRNLPQVRGLKLPGNAEPVENRLGRSVPVNLLDGALGNASDEFLYALRL